MDQWVRIRGQSHTILVTWWQIGVVGLAFLAIGAGTAFWRKSALARALGVVGLVIGLALLVGGIILACIRSHR